MSPRAQWILVTGVIALALGVAAHLVVRPLPLPGLGALAGGVVASWLAGRASRPAALAGGVLGTLAGVLVHYGSHRAEGRLEEPAEGLAAHLGVDAGIGLLAAGPALLFTLVLARRWLEERPGAEPQA